ERLRDRDLTDEVHLELPAELVEREELERHRDGDAGVVDEALEPVVAEPLCRSRDRGCVGHVECDRLDVVGTKTLGVGTGADAGEDAPARAGEAQRAGLADPGRGTGDDDAPGGAQTAAGVPSSASATAALCVLPEPANDCSHSARL